MMNFYLDITIDITKQGCKATAKFIISHVDVFFRIVEGMCHSEVFNACA